MEMVLNDKKKSIMLENENLLQALDRGIDDMETGRELPLDEAFQKIAELRKKRLLIRNYR